MIKDMIYRYENFTGPETASEIRQMISKNFWDDATIAHCRKHGFTPIIGLTMHGDGALISGVHSLYERIHMNLGYIISKVETGNVLAVKSPPLSAQYLTAVESYHRQRIKDNGISASRIDDCISTVARRLVIVPHLASETNYINLSKMGIGNNALTCLEYPDRMDRDELCICGNLVEMISLINNSNDAHRHIEDIFYKNNKEAVGAAVRRFPDLLQERKLEAYTSPDYIIASLENKVYSIAQRIEVRKEEIWNISRKIRR